MTIITIDMTLSKETSQLWLTMSNFIGHYWPEQGHIEFDIQVDVKRFYNALLECWLEK